MSAAPAAQAEGATAADQEDSASPLRSQKEAVSIQPTENLCFGGLEDGKIIVSEPYLKNPYKETTHLGCEVDGGAPVTMPDLPAPDSAKTRLV